MNNKHTPRSERAGDYLPAGRCHYCSLIFSRMEWDSMDACPRCGHRDHLVDTPEWEHAPDLLAALEKLEARVDWFLSEDFGKALGVNYNPLPEEFFELEQARAAIRKARGE